jgi:hypothetical protein
MRTLAILTTFGLLAAVSPRDAAAVAHHEQVVVQKLRDANKKVIGARVHMIIDPENYDKVRINVGKLKLHATNPADAKSHVPDTEHREIAAGIRPGYVRMMLGELTGLKLKQGQTGQFELQEVKFDLIYGHGNDIKAGEKVDIYTTFNEAHKQATYWHVFGMHDGPVNVKDAAHVHEMPSDTSAHAEATEFGQ